MTIPQRPDVPAPTPRAVTPVQSLYLRISRLPLQTRSVEDVYPSGKPRMTSDTSSLPKQRQGTSTD